MEFVTRIVPVASQSQQLEVHKPKVDLPSGLPKQISFKDVLEEVGTRIREFSDVHQILNDFQTRAMQGKAFSAKDLFAYQIKASQFNITVELVSKAVESGMTSVRKLQTNQ